MCSKHDISAGCGKLARRLAHAVIGTGYDDDLALYVFGHFESSFTRPH